MTIQGKYRQMIDKVSSPKEFFGLVAGIVVSTVTILTWASVNFVTAAKAEEMMKEARGADSALAIEIKNLATDIKESNNLIQVHLGKHDLDSVLDRIRENETQTFNIKQFTRVNGSDNQSEARMQQLEIERDALLLKRDCIINNNPLCD